ncbi:hypothetical protein [Limobrevibacterium gyesilva]|uniref:Uncharacterized protein n=1 Tax=Limobrevibacterium gyesilva TaxID=2991712 RepID=A0AA42CFP1_9PROT|nr:hypothetical protein [Limobrevibacterium gyesilva]MCW3476869.1 hypothetical protein [Limobrevibacterium gyesilva]
MPTLCGGWACEIHREDDGTRRAFLIARDWGDGSEAAFVICREAGLLTLADHRRTPAFGNAEWSLDLAESAFASLDELQAHIAALVGRRRTVPGPAAASVQPG